MGYIVVCEADNIRLWVAKAEDTGNLYLWDDERRRYVFERFKEASDVRTMVSRALHDRCITVSVMEV